MSHITAGSATATRERLASPSHGSRTLTVEETAQEDRESSNSPLLDDSIGVLRLTGDMAARRPPVVRWGDDVVDNEHMGKKKSKICCIYHKPREVGESSDSESSSSSSTSSSSSDNNSDDDNTDHDGKKAGECSHQHRHRHRHGRKKKRNPRHVSPNAYERQPVYKSRPQPGN